MNTDGEKFLLAEYAHLTAELSRYDNDATKLVQLGGGLSLVTVFAEKTAAASIILFFVPYLAALIYLLALSNRYAYMVRERYIVEIERIAASSGPIAPCFYSRHAPAFWRPRRLSTIFMPIILAVFGGIVFLLALGGYSVFRCWTLFGLAHRQLLYIHVALTGMTVLACIISGFASQRRANKSFLIQGVAEQNAHNEDKQEAKTSSISVAGGTTPRGGQ